MILLFSNPWISWPQGLLGDAGAAWLGVINLQQQDYSCFLLACPWSMTQTLPKLKGQIESKGQVWWEMNSVSWKIQDNRQCSKITSWLKRREEHVSDRSFIPKDYPVSHSAGEHLCPVFPFTLWSLLDFDLCLTIRIWHEHVSRACVSVEANILSAHVSVHNPWVHPWLLKILFGSTSIIKRCFKEIICVLFWMF